MKESSFDHDRRSGVDRRSVIDRRSIPGLDQSKFSGSDRRRKTDRRSTRERRSGWFKIGQFCSVCIAS